MLLEPEVLPPFRFAGVDAAYKVYDKAA
jgi:hypothetical protein